MYIGPFKGKYEAISSPLRALYGYIGPLQELYKGILGRLQNYVRPY